MATPEHVAIQHEMAERRQAEAVEAINAKLDLLLKQFQPVELKTSGAELSMPSFSLPDMVAKVEAIYAQLQAFAATHQELIAAVETIGSEVSALASRGKGR